MRKVKMNVIETDIREVKIIEPIVYGDSRGYFFESFSSSNFIENVCNTIFIQDNESKSIFGVLRGLHFQQGHHAQSKLVRVVKGTVLDVAVDIRSGSPTFGSHVAVELSEENKRQLFVPRGFAHGFVVLSEEAIFQYKCDNYYEPASEAGIAFDDPALNIDWRIDKEKLILSDKDKKNPLLINSNALFDYSTNLYG